jgi:hypothetical protein
MNKDQFIYWLKGFARAVNEEGPTRGQWGIISSELDKIKDCPDYGSPIEEFKPNPMWQEPYYPNQFDKYKITCQPDTNLTVTTGSGTTYGIITNGNTSWTNLPKDANVSYTSDNEE